MFSADPAGTCETYVEEPQAFSRSLYTISGKIADMFSHGDVATAISDSVSVAGSLYNNNERFACLLLFDFGKPGPQGQSKIPPSGVRDDRL